MDEHTVLLAIRWATVALLGSVALAIFAFTIVGVIGSIHDWRKK